MSAVRRVTLQEVATIERDIVEPDRIKAGTLFVGLENIESGGRFVDVRAVDAGELASSKFAFTPRHVLYGKLRPYLAKIARPNFEGICSTDILPVLPGPELDRSYLSWLLLSPEMVSLAASRATGANLPRLSPTALAEMKIPLPSLSEQRRIAVILDKADALRAKRRAALAQLDTLTQSIFLDMFGDLHANRQDWPVTPVGHFVSGFESGKNLVADDEDDASSRFRVLKVSAVTSMHFRPEESKALPPAYAPPPSHFVRRGDLLFSRANTAELIGATALVYDALDGLVLPDKLWRFCWHDEPRADPRFVQWLFRQPKFRFEVARRATGTSGSMKNISQEKVLEIRVALPPLTLQTKFGQAVRGVERMRSDSEKALVEVGNLFASLQYRAFRSEI